MLGEKQYDAYIATLSDKSNAEMANLKNSDEAKGLKQVNVLCWYKSTCFTNTEVQILTPEELRVAECMRP